MSQTQSVIVYRNPAEAAFWESGMAFPLMASLFVFLVVFLLLNTVFERQVRQSKNHNIFLVVFGIVASISSFTMFNVLMI